MSGRQARWLTEVIEMVTQGEARESHRGGGGAGGGGGGAVEVAVGCGRHRVRRSGAAGYGGDRP
jgi:hypothetical protein